MLLWFDGQWTTSPANWPEPFPQHEVTDSAHHILQQLHPLFHCCCWESRLAQGGLYKVVDQGARCPLTLYICGNKSPQHNDLQGMISTWSVASFGLPARCYMHPHWSPHLGNQGLASFLCERQAGAGQHPLPGQRLSHHLGSKAGSGHYWTAILAGGNWWVYADDMESALFHWWPERTASSLAELPTSWGS